MDNDQYRILEIIKRCLTGEGDPAEETALENWLEQSSKHRAFFDSIRDGMENKKRNEVFARINEKEVLKRWDRKIG